jgi:hypothetical protein
MNSNLTPAERALLVAIGETILAINHDPYLKETISAVRAEDDLRARNKRMTPISREAYNERMRRP